MAGVLGGTIPPPGRLAQLVERLPYKQEVGGSSPSPPIIVLLATWIGRSVSR
jgi:hypothetical protein